jgi:type I restriction enzyme S subunit
LGSCGQFLSGGTPDRSTPEYWNGTIPWISAKSLKVFDLYDSDDRVTEAGAATGSKIIPEGTLLFVVRGMSLANEFTVGVTARPVTFNQDLRGLIPASDMDARYIGHFLRASASRILRLVDHASHGTARLTADRLEALDIPVPPLGEQRRIAEVLDRAGALRAKRRAALAQLDTLTEALFLDLFGDPATNPKGWKVSVVGETADVQGGLQVSSARKSCPLEVPYLRVANVFRGFLDLSEIKTLRATDGEIARTTLVKDDLLVVEGHGNPKEIGRAALWDGSVVGCVHQNHIIRVRFRGSRLLPRYACEYLNSPGGRRHLLRAGKTTSGLNTISVSEVRTNESRQSA